MKKIYSVAVGLFVCGSIMAQSAMSPALKTHQAQLPANAKPAFSVSASPSRTLGPKYWIEPVGDVMTTYGYIGPGTSTPTQDNFLDIVYQDSTATVSDPTNGTSAVSTILLGSVLDPKSPDLQSDFTPILGPTEAYSIDSLQIIGSYVQVTPTIDTLYTWLVWGDTANTSVFVKRATSAIWVAPISTWRPYIIGPKVTGAVGAYGNKVKAAAPAANRMLVKYVLTAADASTGAGFSTVISIALPTPANIPAGNIVSCFYTFVPGTTTALGDCSYSFDGSPDLQTVNGFAGMIWGQTTPAVNAVTDYQNQQVDIDGFNMGADYNKEQRHALYSPTYTNSLWGDLVTAPLIYYSLYSNTTVGVNEQAAANDMINIYPNPSTGFITVNSGATTSKSVVEVYNVVGEVVFSKEFNSQINTIDLNSLAKGVYTVKVTSDNTVSTKKVMITK